MKKICGDSFNGAYLITPKRITSARKISTSCRAAWNTFRIVSSRGSFRPSVKCVSVRTVALSAESSDSTASAGSTTATAFFVVRFTGQLHAADVNATASELARRSGVDDVTKMPVGSPVRIIGSAFDPAVITDEFGNHAIVPRKRGYLSLGYDHRVVNGADGDQFLARVKQLLETFPEQS